MMTLHTKRRNLVDVEAEIFKPPVFRSTRSSAGRRVASLRRLLDLQAGSAWRDMREELAQVSGPVLDVGCGAQVFRDLIPAHVSYRGIDTSDAKRRFGYEVPDTYYFDDDDWQIPTCSMDVVLCTEVLEHVVEPLPFLERIAGCLRPGGKLVATVPFAARWHFIPYDYWRFTPSSLDILLRQAGFEEVRVNARGNPVTVACYKAMALILILLLNPTGSRWARSVRQFLGLLMLPILLLLGLAGTLSLRSDWGDDCLGYTFTARKLCEKVEEGKIVTN